jgi:predicted ribosome quality control (RQC) complex YloA/Tae2 family protein
MTPKPVRRKRTKRRRRVAQTYTVRVDGEEVEVTIDELLSGYSRTQDYTRKTMALADQRKSLETELEQIRQERAQLTQVLSKLMFRIKSKNPTGMRYISKTHSNGSFSVKCGAKARA